MKYLVFTLALLLSINLESQCPDSRSFCLSGSRNGWLFNNQSKSATFEKGETYEMSFIAYKGISYRLAVCTDLRDESEDIEFEIYESKSVAKKIDGRVRYVKEYVTLYSNNEDQMEQIFTFSSDKTRKLFLRMKVPTGESKDKDNNQLDLLCVGVLLEHQKTPKTGF